jgi:molybdopterin molybdotransferase
MGVDDDNVGTGVREHRDTTALDLRSGTALPSDGGVQHTAQIDPGAMPPPPGTPELPRTVESHLDEILGAVPQPDPIELAVLDAQGLLCAEEVVSKRALPAYDQAALDGYAVRADDVTPATLEAPIRLSVVGETTAGAAGPTSIGPGLAHKVAAGALLPGGADAVVPAVWTDRGVVAVTVHAGVAAGNYVRRTGDDVAAGTPAVAVGTPIGPAQISLLAAVGRERVLVRPRPRVGILSGGGELVDIANDPAPGQVVDVNSYALAAAARDAGADAYRSGILPADARRLSEVLESQTLRSDLILISGTFPDEGDMVREALSALGDVRFRPVTMHPGSVQAFGRIGRDAVPVIVVPGEPVAALVAFEVFVRPAIRLMLGKRQLFRRTVQAICAQPVYSPLGYRQYLHGQVMRHPDGGYVVEPLGDGDEAMLARMARANCLIVVDEDVTEVAAGGLVTVMPLLLGG